MTDRELLQDTITQSGLKKQYIAEQLGLSRQGLRLKLNGEHEFLETEMQKLCELLSLNKQQRDRIFFAKKVDK